MKDFIKRMPIGIGGTMLGVVSLGNLLGGAIAPVLASISAAIGILFLIKIFIYGDEVLDEMRTPIGASVAPTFAMAIVMLSRYASLYINHSFGKFLYFFGIFFHLALMLYFTGKFRKTINSKEIYGSYMIVYGSFGAGAIVAPFFQTYAVGKIVWVVGMVFFIPLLLLVLYKDRHYPEKEEVKMPLVCIAAANGGLLLAGYFNSFENYKMAFVIFMIMLGQVIYFIALSRLPNYLRMNFYPSFSSFTFPFVINATALKMSGEYFANLGYELKLVNAIARLEIVIAILLVAFVFFMYIRFLSTGKDTSILKDAN